MLAHYAYRPRTHTYAGCNTCLPHVPVPATTHQTRLQATYRRPDPRQWPLLRRWPWPAAQDSHHSGRHKSRCDLPAAYTLAAALKHNQEQKETFTSMPCAWPKPAACLELPLRCMALPDHNSTPALTSACTASRQKAGSPPLALPCSPTPGLRPQLTPAWLAPAM